MPNSVLGRIPVVGGLGYIERVKHLPPAFTAQLVPERDNRYFPHAVAVLVSGEKVGYVAPEICRRYFEALSAHQGEPVTCPGRHASIYDHQTSGVELLLDFSNLPVAPAP
jgi:hypothetical protein